MREEPTEGGRGKPQDEVRSGRVSDARQPEEPKNFGALRQQMIIEVDGQRRLVAVDKK